MSPREKTDTEKLNEEEDKRLREKLGQRGFKDRSKSAKRRLSVQRGFCISCGADVPPRPSEGTCPDCES